ncbi:hypothetical protein ACGFIW_15420 [Micromonospora sp. NPDC048935]|uniref:hypothetical protein n=1 Tax=Micromonospora sp. NPDC048935 TaxID=3364262 RepID=UPI00371A3055
MFAAAGNAGSAGKVVPFPIAPADGGRAGQRGGGERVTLLDRGERTSGRDRGGRGERGR